MRLKAVGKVLTERRATVKLDGIKGGAEIVVKDIDGDGDQDVAVYIGGVLIGSMELAKLASNVRREVERAIDKLRKRFKKK